MSLYEVVGRHAYREHAPGETFEADLDAAVEQRAIARGDITLLHRSRTQIQPGTWTLPVGWTSNEREE